MYIFKWIVYTFCQAIKNCYSASNTPVYVDIFIRWSYIFYNKNWKNITRNKSAVFKPWMNFIYNDGYVLL